MLIKGDLYKLAVFHPINFCKRVEIRQLPPILLQN